MSYIKAETILPKELIETIQQYVEGKSIYIPSKEKLEWGSRTELFEAFQANDEETAVEYGRDIDFLKKNNAELMKGRL